MLPALPLDPVLFFCHLYIYILLKLVNLVEPVGLVEIVKLLKPVRLVSLVNVVNQVKLVSQGGS